MKNFASEKRVRPDAIVIGAGIGGLVAAACLTRAGKRVLVLEREPAPPEPIGPIHALDPLLLKELRLPARGLRFAVRDLKLALASEPSLELGRERHASARALSVLSARDAAHWAKWRGEVHELARSLRRWWWSALEEGDAGWMLGRQRDKARFHRLCFSGADAFLAGHFESNALVAALLFDASAGGFHVSEPGSALALVWRAAQQMAGLEGASAMVAPGTLVWSLIKAAGATDFRCCATVSGLLVRGGAAAGVRLESGEELETGMVFSSLTRPASMTLAGCAPPSSSRIGEARMLLGLTRKIAFPAARLILAGRSGIYADAHEAALDGKLAGELPMEFSPAALEDGRTDRIAVIVRPVPALLSREDRVQLAARALQALSRQVPGTAALLSDVRFAASSAGARASLAQLLAPSIARVKTNIAGYYLCGADAEPLASLSGRAARIATNLALKESLSLRP